MPGFGDSAFIIVLALLLFGPKKLPVLARQLGKLMAEFRRASNEFRTQMEEELRIAEQAERQKQVEKLQASSPSSATTSTEPEEPHIPPPAPTFAEPDTSSGGETPSQPVAEAAVAAPEAVTPELAAAPEPIATSGELTIMPPATGLPVAATSTPNGSTAPEKSSTAHEAEFETETLHG